MPASEYVTEAITDVTKRRRELAQQLAMDGNKALFPALFDLHGRLVTARLVTTHRGSVWAILASDDPHSEVIGWFPPSRATSREVQRRHDAAKGYYVGSVIAHARVAVIGSTPAHRRVAIVRDDDGFSRDVTIVDNGV